MNTTKTNELPLQFKTWFVFYTWLKTKYPDMLKQKDFQIESKEWSGTGVNATVEVRMYKIESDFLKARALEENDSLPFDVNDIRNLLNCVRSTNFYSADIHVTNEKLIKLFSQYEERANEIRNAIRF
jgi:hypothetical protein